MEILSHIKNTNLKAIHLLLLLFVTSAFSQYSEEFSSNKSKHPDEQMVRLNNSISIKLEVKDGKLDITQETLQEDIYLTEAATYNSKDYVSSSSFFELQSIEASSFQYENGKYKETEVEEFKSKDEIDNSFFDDLKTHNFVYPKLKKGSKTKLNYTEKIKDPRFLSPFYFGSYMPINTTKVEIVADKNISLRFKEFNTEGVNIQFSKKEKKGQIVYTWELKNSKKYKYEESVSSYKNIFPHIIPIINSYQTKDKTVKVLENVSDLYNWYYSLVKDINKENADPELVALVKQLTSNKTDDLEKVRAIYYWTQNNIKYIDYEYSLGGFIPRDANVVYKKKYGDCKDNSSILKQMLDIAGLEGDLTWVGTRSIPYKYDEVPTPIVDNHMILSYEYEGKRYFLDATGRYIPLDFPSSFIQGKEALVEGGKDHFKLVKIPIVSADKSGYKDITTLKIEGDKITGTAKAILKGYKKNNFFNYLETKTTKEEIQEFYNLRLRKGNNKFLIENIKETNKYEYDKNLIVDYNFTIESYVKKIADEIYINLNLNHPASIYKTKDDREYDISFKYKQKYQFETTLEIPEGYVVDYIPENEKFANDIFESIISYEEKDHKIYYKHTLTVDFLNLSTKQQKEINKLIKKVEKAYKEVIVLKKSE